MTHTSQQHGSHDARAATAESQTSAGKHDRKSRRESRQDKGSRDERSGRGTFAPLRHLDYSLFTGALFLSASGTWAFAVGAGWLMTDLGASDTMVALVQTASFLPVVLLSILAGAVGDRFDRRWVLMITTLAMMANAVAIALVVDFGLATPWLVLMFTMLDGTGSVFARPTQNAVVPTLVPRKELFAAVALRSVAFNLARAGGPAAAGVLVAVVGLSGPFWMDAVSFLAVVAFLLFWKETRKRSDLPPETLARSMRGALHFLRYDPSLRATLAKTILFFLPAAAMWSLLPILARDRLDGGALLYGLLLGGAGVGAVVAGLLAGALKTRVGADRMFCVAGLVLAGVLFGLGRVDDPYFAFTLTLTGGMAWQTAFTLANSSAQFALPDWIGARGMSFYQMAMFGGLATGSVAWGALSDATSLGTSLTCAGGLAVLLAFAALPFRLDDMEGANLAPASDYPTHDGLRLDPSKSRCPVLVEITYRTHGMSDAQRARLVADIRDLGLMRARAGASEWGLHEVIDHTQILKETFVSSNWLAHERESERMTVDACRKLDSIKRRLRSTDGTRDVVHMQALRPERREKTRKGEKRRGKTLRGKTLRGEKRRGEKLRGQTPDR